MSSSKGKVTKLRKATAPVWPEGKVCLYFVFREPGEERGSHNGSHNFPLVTAEDRTECVMGDDSGHCILKKTESAQGERPLGLFRRVMNNEQKQEIWSVYVHLIHYRVTAPH